MPKKKKRKYIKKSRAGELSTCLNASLNSRREGKNRGSSASIGSVVKRLGQSIQTSGFCSVASRSSVESALSTERLKGIKREDDGMHILSDSQQLNELKDAMAKGSEDWIDIANKWHEWQKKHPKEAHNHDAASIGEEIKKKLVEDPRVHELACDVKKALGIEESIGDEIKQSVSRKFNLKSDELKRVLSLAARTRCGTDLGHALAEWEDEKPREFKARKGSLVLLRLSKREDYSAVKKAYMEKLGQLKAEKYNDNKKLTWDVKLKLKKDPNFRREFCNGLNSDGEEALKTGHLGLRKDVQVNPDGLASMIQHFGDDFPLSQVEGEVGSESDRGISEDMQFVTQMKKGRLLSDKDVQQSSKPGKRAADREGVCFKKYAATYKGEPVVVKEIHSVESELEGLPHDLQMKEAYYANQVDPHKVIGVTKTGALILRAEQNETLDQHLTGQFSQAEIAEMVAPLVEDLKKLHDQGIAHQALTLENVFVKEDGTCALTGFYSCEKDEGEDVSKKKADIKDLGKILYCLLEGKQQCRVPPQISLKKRVENPELAEIIDQCFEDQRPPNTVEGIQEKLNKLLPSDTDLIDVHLEEKTFGVLTGKGREIRARLNSNEALTQSQRRAFAQDFIEWKRKNPREFKSYKGYDAQLKLEDKGVLCSSDIAALKVLDMKPELRRGHKRSSELETLDKKIDTYSKELTRQNCVEVANAWHEWRLKNPNEYVMRAAEMGKEGELLEQLGQHWDQAQGPEDKKELAQCIRMVSQKPIRFDRVSRFEEARDVQDVQKRNALKHIRYDRTGKNRVGKDTFMHKKSSSLNTVKIDLELLMKYDEGEEKEWLFKEVLQDLFKWKRNNPKEFHNYDGPDIQRRLFNLLGSDPSYDHIKKAIEILDLKKERTEFKMSVPQVEKDINEWADALFNQCPTEEIETKKEKVQVLGADYHFKKHELAMEIRAWATENGVQIKAPDYVSKHVRSDALDKVSCCLFDGEECLVMQSKDTDDLSELEGAFMKLKETYASMPDSIKGITVSEDGKIEVVSVDNRSLRDKGLFVDEIDLKDIEKEFKKMFKSREGISPVNKKKLVGWVASIPQKEAERFIHAFNRLDDSMISENKIEDMQWAVMTQGRLEPVPEALQELFQEKERQNMGELRQSAENTLKNAFDTEYQAQIFKEDEKCKNLFELQLSQWIQKASKEQLESVFVMKKILGPTEFKQCVTGLGLEIASFDTEMTEFFCKSSLQELRKRGGEWLAKVKDKEGSKYNWDDVTLSSKLDLLQSQKQEQLQQEEKQLQQQIESLQKEIEEQIKKGRELNDGRQGMHLNMFKMDDFEEELRGLSVEDGRDIYERKEKLEALREDLRGAEKFLKASLEVNFGELELKGESRPDLSNKKILGKGTYGEVSLVGDKAVKKFKSGDQKKGEIECQNEAYFTQLCFPEREVSYFQKDGDWYLVMPYGGRSLYDVLYKDKTSMDDQAIIGHATRMADQLCKMHEKGLIHFDIKSANVLCGHGDFKGGITDFGLVEKKGDSHQGTPCFMAPELVSGTPPYTNKCDVFSYGLVLYEMLVKKSTPNWSIISFEMGYEQIKKEL